MKVMTIDISNMIMRALFAQTPAPTEKKFDVFKVTFFSTFFKTISGVGPNMVICCLDDGSWRRDVYPEYKSSRSAKRAASIVDFDSFFAVWDALLTKLREVLAETNIKFLDVQKCEADDLVAVVTREHPEWEIVNVSSDRDFYQLFKYGNYRQYDGIKKEFLGTLNPEADLLVKIMTGDRGDDIPAIRKGIGVKTAEKIINGEQGLESWLAENDLNEAFERNTRLISFDSIPVQYVDGIKEEISKFSVIDKPSVKSFVKFAMSSGLADLSVNLANYVSILENIR